MDAQKWNNRYEENDYPWDIGGLSPAIKQYINKLDDKSITILIPGAGHAYEAEYLWNAGFKNVYVCDWAETALASFHQRCSNFPETNLICNDFFKLDGTYDLIIEQTFFCALDPKLREAYVEKMSNLLSAEGVLTGLLFGIIFPQEGPPFGGQLTEYKELFSDHFDILQMETTSLSIEPRMGNELFIELKKK